VEKQQAPVPTEFALSQNYPNPFNPSTTIRYSVAAAGMVQLRIYDMLGRETAVLVNDMKQPGTYTVQWNAGALPSGVYLCRMSAGAYSSVMKLVLQK
jgi:hypothetical protein